MNAKTFRIATTLTQRVVFRGDEFKEALVAAVAYRDGVARVLDGAGNLDEEATVARWMRARTREFYLHLARNTDGESAQVQVAITAADRYL